MKTIRKIAHNPIFLLFLTISFLNLSCSNDEMISKNEESLDNYSGEEIFKSLIFADGPVTESIPSLKLEAINYSKYSENELKTFRNFQNEVIVGLRKSNRNYFMDFKDKIVSGDLVVVSNTIKDASNLVYSFTKEKFMSQNVDLDKIVEEYNNGDFDINDYQANKGVGLAILITVVIALVLVVNVTITSTSTSDVLTDQQAIKFDKFVYEVAQLK